MSGQVFLEGNRSIFTPAGEREALERLLGSLAPGQRLSLGEASLVLTPELAELLRKFLEALLLGEPVQVVPLEAELTTQQAAELLGVSRPHLVRLLEEGKIPYRKVGTHRRVRARELLEYLEQARRRGREGMAELVRESQELGLYEVD